MFIDRLLSLCDKSGTDVSNVLRSLNLSTSKGTAWRKGSVPNGEILLMLAEYFDTSTDYLLGKTDDPTPAGQKEKPASGEADGLSEEELELIRLYGRASLETQAAALGMLRAAEAARATPDDERGDK